MNYYSRIYSILSEAKKLTDYDPFGATDDQNKAYQNFKTTKGDVKKSAMQLDKLYGKNRDFNSLKNIAKRTIFNQDYLENAKQHGQNIKNLQAQGVKVHNLKTRSPLSGTTKGLARGAKGLARGINFVRNLFK